jgi:transposase-like protein
MKTKQRKVGEDKDAIIRDLPKACQDELLAVEFMEKQRWGEYPACTECGSLNVYKMISRDGDRIAPYRWRCREKECNTQFTVRTGTVFEDSRIPMKIWCHAFWRACTSKKGVSALQIKRETGLSYKSALFLMHRIRFAMGETLDGQLDGTVEVDETYVGGKPRKFDGKKHKPGRGTEKACVLGMVERDGRIRFAHIEGPRKAVVLPPMLENISREARLCTDDFMLYRSIGKPFASHMIVNHSSGEYVYGDTHTNTIEGAFSLIKRGVYGTFHSISKKHLHRYLCEFEFRYNSRWESDGERVVKAIKAARGKRLTYKQQTK